MKKFLVVGGRRRPDSYWNGSRTKADWHLFQSGVILEVDPEKGTARTLVEHVTPDNACAIEDEPSILFKSATLEGNRLFACTQTEVLVYALPAFERIAYVTLPCFNDVHHVLPSSNGSVLVAVTGLDMVMEVSLEGSVLREWDVLGRRPWVRFSKERDYRKVVTTKPHDSHPNYVFRNNDEIWVTRFEQKDAVCLNDFERRIDIGIERPHDGVVFGDVVYFTTVDGHIVIADIETLERIRVINLNDLKDVSRYHANKPLGWCRGLSVVDDSHILVGFTRLRPTKWRENVQWVKRAVGLRAGSLPTRVALYDIRNCRLCWEMNLDDKGVDAIFSIHTSVEL